jgi:hypothetical protein
MMVKQTKEKIGGDEILACLRMHLVEQRPVTLHNTYQGVPVKTEADVALVHEDFLGLIVHPYQAVCIKDARYTFIESKSLPVMIRAYPVSIDYTNRVVMLKQLKIPQSINVDLYHTWVAPDKPIQVALQSTDGSIEGESLTVDMLGIAVLEDNRVRVVMAVSEDFPYSRREKVSLSFRLDQKSEPISVQGAVHSLVKLRNKAQKRLEVDGRTVMADEVTILAYIARREDQIMNALDKAYKKLRKGKKSTKR